MSEKQFTCVLGNDYRIINNNVDDMTYFLQDGNDVVLVINLLNKLYEENEWLRKQIQNDEKLLSNSYVGEEETLDGFVGKYVIWEDELQKYKEKIKKVIDD